MLAILQMDLKIAYRRFGTRSIQFARTVVAADARQEHVFDAVGGGAWWWSGAGHFREAVDGGVAHYAFEAVVGVLF